MAPLTLPRVYPILDGDALARRGIEWTDACQALLEGGARFLQLRWKGEWTRSVYVQARLISTMCREAGATLIVNDRSDVALLLDAGVHVGQDDLPPADARRVLGPERVLGVSTHNENQFRAAVDEPVDYVAIGPIFNTVSKANPDPVVGVPELHRLRTLTPKPIVAIGGITRSRAREVWNAGANTVAVIGDLYPQGCTAADIRARMEEWMRVAHE